MAKYASEKTQDHALLDLQTGEITDLYITKKVTVDQFIMVFFSSCPKLMELTGLHLKVLICCWKCSSFNPNSDEESNIVHNNKSFKEECKENGMEVSDASIDNAISALCRKGFLQKRCRGEYRLNPEYFFRGKLSNRSKLRINCVVEPSEVKEETVF